MKLSQFQLQEFAKYWLDLSKIVVASLVIKFFEPSSPKFTVNSLLPMLGGLTLAFAFVMIALRIAKEGKK